MSLNPKYESDQALIIKHASLWIELMVHPIMANIEATYALATSQTKQTLYNMCIEANAVSKISEYSNTTCTLRLPEDVYENLQVIRVMVRNVNNIFELIGRNSFPVLRVLEIETIDPMIIARHPIETLEELSILGGQLFDSRTQSNTQGQLHIGGRLVMEEILNAYPHLDKLIVHSYTIEIEGRAPRILTLEKCEILLRSKLRSRPDVLALRECQCKGEFNLSCNRVLETDMMTKIAARSTLEEITFIGLGAVKLPFSPRRINLFESICDLREGLEELSITRVVLPVIPQSVRVLNLSSTKVADQSMFTQLRELTLHYISDAIKVNSLIQECKQLVLLEIIDCNVSDRVLEGSNPELIFKYYNSRLMPRAIDFGTFKEVHVTGISWKMIHIHDAHPIRTSEFGFTIMSMTQFVKHCIENYQNKQIDKYEEIVLDLINMTRSDQRAYKGYLEYFLSMKCTVPKPEITVFYHLIRYGNPRTRVIFPRSANEYMVESIRDPNLDSAELDEANREYRQYVEMIEGSGSHE